MGFVMLGISTLTHHGINAAMFGMVAHGLITGMLFFVAGSVKERYHTLEIKRLGGLLVQAPKHGLDPRLLLRWRRSACPGLAGFWGEFPAILSAYQPADGPQRRAVPHAHGHRLARHRARRRLPAVAVPAHRVRHAVARSSPTIRTSTTSTRTEWIAWTPLLVAHRPVRLLSPGLMFDVTETAPIVCPGPAWRLIP